MKKVILTIFFIAYINIIALTRAFASESLSISPQTIRILATTGSTTETVVKLKNNAQEDQNITYEIKPFTSDENGSILFTSSFRKQQDFSGMIGLYDGDNALKNNFTLGPSEEKTITIKVNPEPQSKPNDYYFSILFITKNNNDISRNASHIQIGLATNLILSIDQNEDSAQGLLEEFSAPLLQEHGPIPFTVKVKNNGNVVFEPTGYILISNMFGQTVGKVDLSSRYVLKDTQRLIPEMNHTQADSKAYWPERITFGLYKADLYLQFFPNGQIIHKSIHFLSFPDKLLSVSIVLIVFIAIVLHRAKRYMS